MSQLVYGSVLLASFLGGVVALLAPCCVSVMLPAYLATGMQRRGGVLVATLVFALGVATVIVPIGLGASALSGLVSGHHLVVFAIGGLLMVVGGLAVLVGWKASLPMPVGRLPGGRGWVATYALGVFSGAASSCCAPVLAGVAVLSGATASFPAALAVALTYVAGMVAPLCVLALVWDRREGAARRLLQGRNVQLWAGSWARRMPLGSLLSGLLLVVMGALTVVIAFAGPGMGGSGWQVRFTAELQHAASLTTRYGAWLPGWAFGVLLAVGFVLLVRAARSGRGAGDGVNAPVEEPCCAADEAVAPHAGLQGTDQGNGIAR
ncbi:cytochrome c biogenesis protein CcdA [Streptomyces caniferus]|uniref:cytochrome c biogenesis CcdA family protein n=1 Tax=Streptomyces caniferus TaxID=285557 RepID=UPI002E2AAA1E|nr:cytochrome c biogenesis protein CcdA [Streptomyces caniferus]